MDTIEQLHINANLTDFHKKIDECVLKINELVNEVNKLMDHTHETLDTHYNTSFPRYG